MADSPPTLTLHRLCAICDVDAAARAGWAPLDLLRAFLDGGARFVQIRAKSMSGRALLELARAAVAMARAVDARLIVNDRAEIAALSGADGVHVGQDDLSPVDVRRILGPGAIVGLSTHTGAQLEAALGAPIDYAAVGPVFGTSTKATGYEPIGLPHVARAAATAHERGRSLVAIGGITLDTAPSVVEAGADSVAVIADLIAGGSPEARVRAYVLALARVHPAADRHV